MPMSNPTRILAIVLVGGACIAIAIWAAVINWPHASESPPRRMPPAAKAPPPEFKSIGELQLSMRPGGVGIELDVEGRPVKIQARSFGRPLGAYEIDRVLESDLDDGCRVFVTSGEMLAFDWIPLQPSGDENSTSNTLVQSRIRAIIESSMALPSNYYDNAFDGSAIGLVDHTGGETRVVVFWNPQAIVLASPNGAFESAAWEQAGMVDQLFKEIRSR